MVFLITGKKGAGKSHYAKELAKELKNESFSVEIIDGDQWRKVNNNSDFSDNGRIKNLMMAAQLAAELEEAGITVILSFVAPCKRWRKMMRAAWRESILIYLPGGELWEGTKYERPSISELKPILGGK